MTNAIHKTARRRLLVVALPACLTAAGLTAAFLTAPSAAADQPATCQSRHVDGVEEDVCVGIPGQARGADPRDLYPGVVPELYFGVGIG
ncbi:hypothetical protein [Mycobacterium sp. HM-7]